MEQTAGWSRALSPGQWSSINLAPDAIDRDREERRAVRARRAPAAPAGPGSIRCQCAMTTSHESEPTRSAKAPSAAWFGLGGTRGEKDAAKPTRATSQSIPSPVRYAQPGPPPAGGPSLRMPPGREPEGGLETASARTASGTWEPPGYRRSTAPLIMRSPPPVLLPGPASARAQVASSSTLAVAGAARAVATPALPRAAAAPTIFSERRRKSCPTSRGAPSTEGACC